MSCRPNTRLRGHEECPQGETVEYYQNAVTSNLLVNRRFSPNRVLAAASPSTLQEVRGQRFP